MTDLPEGWREMRLDEIATHAAGRTPSRANSAYWSESEGTPWVSISDMQPFGVVTQTKEQITDWAFKKVFRGRAVSPGTLIMSFKLTIGRVATLGIEACHNEAIIAIRPKTGVDQKFLEYYLSQVDYTEYQDRQVKGQTLNQEKINRIMVTLPDLAEQQRISCILSLARTRIDAERGLIGRANELKRSALAQLFSRGLRRRDTAVGPIPESWAFEPLGNYLLKAQYGLSLKGGSSGKYPILRMNCQTDGRVTFRDLQYVDLDSEAFHAFRLRDGDLLFNRTNSYELVGRTAVFQSSRDAVFASYLIRLTLDVNAWLPEFVNYYLNWDLIQADLKRLASRGVGQANISASKLREYEIPRPPIDEQREIVAVLQAFDAQIDVHRRKYALFEELFKTLLHKLMTGEVRVANLSLGSLLKAEAAA